MLGNKTFDIRTNKGGEVSLKEGGRHEFVVALDFASMYPYVAESFNIDSSAIVPIELIEEFKKCKNNEKIETIYDLINPSGRGRITLKTGEIIEELFTEFKNNKDEIIKEISIWNSIVDEFLSNSLNQPLEKSLNEPLKADINQTSQVQLTNQLNDALNESLKYEQTKEQIRVDVQTYIKLCKHREILKYLYPKYFECLGLPIKIEIISKNEKAYIKDKVLYFPNIHRKVKDVANVFNTTNIVKRKWNMILMLQAIEDNIYWDSIISFFRLNAGKTCYKKDIDNLKNKISEFLINRASITELNEYLDKIKLRKDKDEFSMSVLKMEQTILSLRFKLNRYLVIEKIDIKESDILPSERIPIWTKQSHRGLDRQILPNEHHALKEIYNHFLRAARNNVKKELKLATSYVEKLRLNSFQNAIKVLMNSEYGASGASFFPFFNPVIPSITTASARASIHFLTRLLEQPLIWIDIQFLKDNEKLIKQLLDVGIIRKISKVNTNDFFNSESASKALTNDSLKDITLKDINSKYISKALTNEISKDDSTIDILKDIKSTTKKDVLDRFNKLNIKIQSFEKPQYFNCLDRCRNETELLLIEILPSKVIYQDTDSNYYIVPHVYEYLMSDLFKTDIENEPLKANSKNDIETLKTDSINYTPQGIKKVMNSLVLQNQLYILFVALMINRPPGSVGFEHAFIVCRHFNAKKKYYGIDYDDSMIAELNDNTCSHIEFSTNDNSNALKNDALEIKTWKIKPGKTTYCNPNGEFIEVDKRKLLDERVDYFTYAKSQNIKATGMDLARRDQYKFVNLFHLIVIQRDLRIMEFKDNQWVRIKEQKMLDLVLDIINSFDDIWKTLEKDINSKIEFSIDDFVKTINNNPGKANTNIKELNSRYKACGRIDLMPKDFDKVEIISLNPISASEVQSYWINKTITNKNYSNDDIIQLTRQYLKDITKEVIMNISIVNSKIKFLVFNRDVINIINRLYGSDAIIEDINGDYNIIIDIPYDYIEKQWKIRANDSIKSINDKANKDKNGKRIFRKDEIIEYCKETNPSVSIQNAILKLLDKEYYKKRLLKGLTGYLLEELKGNELMAINATEDSDADKIEAIKKLKDSLTLELVKKYRNTIINSKLYSRTNQRINRFNMKKYKKYEFDVEHIIYEVLHYKINIVNDNVDMYINIVEFIENIKNNILNNYNNAIIEYNKITNSALLNKDIDESAFKTICIKINRLMNEYEIILSIYTTIEKMTDIETIDFIGLIDKGKLYKSLIECDINFIDVIGKSWLRKPTKASITKCKDLLEKEHKLNESISNIKKDIIQQEISSNDILGKIQEKIEKNKKILVAKLILKDFANILKN